MHQVKPWASQFQPNLPHMIVVKLHGQGKQDYVCCLGLFGKLVRQNAINSYIVHISHSLLCFVNPVKLLGWAARIISFGPQFAMNKPWVRHSLSILLIIILNVSIS